MKVAAFVTAVLVLAIPDASGAATQTDYEPARCAAAQAYEGPPLRAAPLPPGPPAVLGSKPMPDSLAARLEQAMAGAMAATRSPTMSAAVATAAGRWSATRNADGSPGSARLYWASAGKSATAAVILQLVGEGRLALDDPVSRWVPDCPGGSIITIDHLLLHTSGLFSANEDARWREKPHEMTPAEYVKVAARHGLMFCPGRHWRYTNTGYSLLGQVIEAIEKRPYHEVVNARIFAPLGLDRLRALPPGKTPADVAPLTPTGPDRAVMEPAWGHAMGSVVGPADEMITYWHALLTGRLLRAAQQAKLFERLYPMFDAGLYYGRGVMLYEVPGAGPKRVWLGHSGGTPGAKAVVAWSPYDSALVAVALTGDGSAEATALLLLQQLAPPSAGTRGPGKP
jgi:D-alanyl-D-alanine carboxypeptidase